MSSYSVMLESASLIMSACKFRLHNQLALIMLNLSHEVTSVHFPLCQATLHKDILYMAGQLGLDPPTMLLSSGGPTVELKQALENSEAIAKCFNCSIATSAILFVIYCSASMNESDRIALEKTNLFIKEMKLNDSDNRCSSDVFDPIFLYVLVPDLPKRCYLFSFPL